MTEILTAGEKLGAPVVALALVIFVVVQLLTFISKQQDRIAQIANMTSASNSELAKAITALADATRDNCSQLDQHDKRAEQIGTVVDRIDATTQRIQRKLDVKKAQAAG